MSDSAVRMDGVMDGAMHRLPLRIYYEDTDAVGLVFHANYLRYAERGRTEMLRALGTQHTEIGKSVGVAFAVRRCEIDFRSPAKLDDLLEVQTRITDIGGASIEFEQNVIRRDPDGDRLVVRILLTV